MKKIIRSFRDLSAESLKLINRKPRGIPLRPDDVSPEWLTRALCESYPGTSVAHVSFSHGNQGTTSRARARVSYAESGNPYGLPDAFFIKVPSSSFSTRLFANLLRLGPSETCFYNEIAPYIDLPVPKSYYAFCDRPSQQFIMVLEDLNQQDVKFIDVTHPFSFDEAVSVIQGLASLHAHYWDSPELSGDYSWLKSYRNNNRAHLEHVLCSLSLKPAMKKYIDVFPDKVKKSAKHILGYRDRLDQIWAEPPLTLLHGDAHAGNMYLAKDAVGFLDWQVTQTGQGMRDAAYFMILSLDTEFRKRHQRELVMSYIEALRGKGISFSFETAWMQYRLHALYAWNATLVTAAAAKLQNADIVALGFARANAAVNDLGSLEIIYRN